MNKNVHVSDWNLVHSMEETQLNVFLSQFCVISELFHELGEQKKLDSLEYVKKWCTDQSRSCLYGDATQQRLGIHVKNEIAGKGTDKATQCSFEEFNHVPPCCNAVKQEQVHLKQSQTKVEKKVKQKTKIKRGPVLESGSGAKIKQETSKEASYYHSIPYSGSEGEENVTPLSDEDTVPLIELVRSISHTSLKQRAAKKILKKTVRKPRTHTCKICYKTYFHGTPFSRHLRSHGKGNVCCRYCREIFENYALWLHHKCKALEKRGRKGLKRYCHYCNAVFTNRRKLNKHLRLEHSHHNVDHLYFCRYCGKGFERHSSLFAHFKEHSGENLVCLKCGEFLPDKGSFRKHMEEHERNANFVCEKCGTTFMLKKRYQNHIQAHQKYKCNLCSEDFCVGRDLRVHQKKVHQVLCSRMTGNKFVCSICERVFRCSRMLSLHLKIHIGEKPLECTTCQMYFSSEKALSKHKITNRHMMLAGENKIKNHLCNICGNTYYRKQSLLRHLNYHSGDLPYKCSHCDYCSREHTNLRRHMASHFSQRKFVCETCGASFQDKKTLHDHNEFKHSTEKKFVCEECSMAFKTLGVLRRHQKTHSDQRPWKCSKCSMAFIRLYNLRRHVNSVHFGDGDLPPLKRVKLMDAPEGKEFVKDAYASALPESRKLQPKAHFSQQGQKTHEGEQPLPSGSLERSVSFLPAPQQSNSCCVVQTNATLTLPSTSTRVPSTVVERFVLTPQLLSQIISGNFDVMQLNSSASSLTSDSSRVVSAGPSSDPEQTPMPNPVCDVSEQPMVDAGLQLSLDAINQILLVGESTQDAVNSGDNGMGF